MGLEELAIHGKKDSQHHKSSDSIAYPRSNYDLNQEPCIEVELLGDKPIMYFEEFKNAQKELIQTKSQLYEQKYKVDSLKKRLYDAEQIARDAKNESVILRQKLQDRKQEESFRDQMSKLIEQSQIDQEAHDNALRTIQDEQFADLRKQRLFVKSLVQQVSQVESYINHMSKMQLSNPSTVLQTLRSGNRHANSDDQEEPIVSITQGNSAQTLSQYIGVSSKEQQSNQQDSDIEQDQLESHREKSARLACMFNCIYKTLKNLNDDLIQKKKSVRNQKREIRHRQRMMQKSTDETMSSKIILKNGRDHTSQETSHQETSRSSLQIIKRNSSREKFHSSYGILSSRLEENFIKVQPQARQNIINDYSHIQLDTEKSKQSLQVSEVFTPALGQAQNDSEEGQNYFFKNDSQERKIQNYGALMKSNKPNFRDTQQSTASEYEQNNEQQLLSMVQKLQSDLDQVRNQSSQLIEVNTNLQNKNQKLSKHEAIAEDNQLSKLQNEKQQLVELVNGLKQSQKSQDLMIQYLQGTQNSILQKLQHQVIKNQFSSSLAESAALASNFLQSGTKQSSHQQNTQQLAFKNEAIKEIKEEESNFDDSAIDIMTYMKKKEKKHQQKIENTFSSQACTEPDDTTCGQGLMANEPQSEEKLSVLKLSNQSEIRRKLAGLESHQNVRKQYFNEESQHVYSRASDSHVGGHSTSSITSNNTKGHDISVISMNQLNVQMPLQMQRIKRTESQGVSDDGKEKNPYLETGAFEQNGHFFKDICNEFEDEGSEENKELLVSPVVRHFEALELMQDYNSNQIMMLVNQMKSASVSHSGKRHSEMNGMTMTSDKGTYDEQTLTTLFKQPQVITSQFSLQDVLVPKYQSNLCRSGLESSEQLDSRLLRSERQSSQSDIQDLSMSDQNLSHVRIPTAQQSLAQKKLSTINSKRNDISEFDVYGIQQSRLGSNKILSISDQQIIYNLQDTERTEVNEISHEFNQYNALPATESILQQIKSPQFNQINSISQESLKFYPKSFNQEQISSQFCSKDEHLTSGEVYVSAKHHHQSQKDSSQKTTPVISRMEHNITSGHNRADSTSTQAQDFKDQRIAAQAQAIRELQTVLQMNGIMNGINTEAFEYANQSQTSGCSDAYFNRKHQSFQSSQRSYNTQFQNLQVDGQKNNSYKQLPMMLISEMQKLHETQDNLQDLHSTVQQRRKNNYSPFSTEQGTGRSQMLLRSRSNSPHDTSLAACSDRIEKRTKKMKQEINSIDAEIQMMLQNQIQK